MRNPKNSPKTQNKTKLGFVLRLQSIFLYTVEILKITIKLPPSNETCGHQNKPF